MTHRNGAIGVAPLTGENLKTFFARDAVAVAHGLLGCHLLVDGTGGRITETEAYFPDDEASHTFRGPTPRNGAMFGLAGNVYIYRIYGMHWCLNFVCHPGSAVLIRAVEPLAGEAVMADNRRRVLPRLQLTNGPAKVCQALAVDKQWNGHDLHVAPLQLLITPKLSDQKITQTTRIGISRDADRPWRFYETHNPFVSKHV